MSVELLSGIMVVVLAGLVMGTSAWPLKLMKKFQYEHFAFVSMLVGLLIIPWAITLATCPNAIQAFQSVDLKVLLTANAFTLSWGIAQVLALLCFVRIGVSLTYGILCSVGAAVGVMIPMIFPAPGIFSQAPALFSQSGLIILGGTVILLAGVALVSVAGAGRDKALNAAKAPDAGKNASEQKSKGGFTVGLIMSIIAGVLSVGWGCGFTYSQDAIITAVKAQGASDFGANNAVWAIALIGAVLPNVLYPALLMTKNKSWGVLAANPREIVLSIIYGIFFFAPSLLMGKGMVMLGVLGASVGWGLVQGMLILGGQILGFASGEWRGVEGKPRKQVYGAIVLLIIAMAIIAFGR